MCQYSSQVVERVVVTFEFIARSRGVGILMVSVALLWMRVCNQKILKKGQVILIVDTYSLSSWNDVPRLLSPGRTATTPPILCPNSVSRGSIRPPDNDKG
jgi:hypothetical protein